MALYFLFHRDAVYFFDSSQTKKRVPFNRIGRGIVSLFISPCSVFFFLLYFSSLAHRLRSSTLVRFIYSIGHFAAHVPVFLSIYYNSRYVISIIVLKLFAARDISSVVGFFCRSSKCFSCCVVVRSLYSRGVWFFSLSINPFRAVL